MHLLIDTNIVIPLEPGSVLDEEVNTETAINFEPPPGLTDTSESIQNGIP